MTVKDEQAPSTSTQDENRNLKLTSSDTVRHWEKFGAWVHCIAVVTFDLELGQALEVCYIKSKN